MSSYHNNTLTVVGPESDSDEKPHIPPTPNKVSKRKRTTNPDMGNSMSTANAWLCGDSLSDYDSLGLTRELPAPGYDFGCEQFAPYHGYSGNGTTFANLPPLHVAYNGGDAYGQTYAPPMPMYFDSSGSDMYTVSPYAYDVPVGIDQDVIHTEGQSGDDTKVKAEDQEDVSFTPFVDSEDNGSDYEARRVRKAPKLNKDGVPRKPRQPRAKLLKWDDNDWKNVALGIVWACGENGLQIPFDQASQVVSESCTAGALQQALLKLRGKQISEGFQIPQLKMAWTRKNRKSCSIMSSTNSPKASQQDFGMTKTFQPRKKPTRFIGQQSYIVTLRRAYKEADRYHLAAPYKPLLLHPWATGICRQLKQAQADEMEHAVDPLTWEPNQMRQDLELDNSKDYEHVYTPHYVPDCDFIFEDEE